MTNFGLKIESVDILFVGVGFEQQIIYKQTNHNKKQDDFCKTFFYPNNKQL